MKQVKCPVCAGIGFIEFKSNPSITDMKRIAAKQLHRKGFTMRQIQKALGYKSVSTIKFLLS